MARKKARAQRKSVPFPEDALRALETRVAGDLPQLVLLVGEERYFRSRGLEIVTKAARDQEMEVCRHDPLEADYAPGRLADDLLGGALFQPARCIVLHSAERVLSKQSTHSSANIVAAMLARLDAGAPGSLVLSASKIAPKNQLRVAAEERSDGSAVVVHCRRLWDSPPSWDPDPRKAELVQWTARRAGALGVEIDPSEAAYVAAATGNDLAAIEDQLKRLVGRGREAVQGLVTWDAGASPYEVAEHLVAGDVKRAALGIESLFKAGASQRDGTRTLDAAGNVVQLCSAVSSKLRESVRAAEALRAGGTPNDAMAAAGVRRSRPAQEEFQKRMSSRRPEAWAAMLEEFGAVERNSRSTVPVDANDFIRLALRWRRRAQGVPSQR